MSIEALSQALLALPRPPRSPVARRLVAGLLGCAERELDDPVPARRLELAPERPELSAVLESADFCVIDLETTGFGAGATILEIGAVQVARLRSVSRFQTLVRPPGPIPAYITRLTGIDARLVLDAPPLPEALRRFARWLRSMPAAVPVAHNAPFDAGFLERAFRGEGWPAPPGPWLCTRRLARRVLPELRSYGLDVLCAHLAIRNDARHRALGDAEATARALIALGAEARRRAGVRTLAELLELQQVTSRRAASRR